MPVFDVVELPFCKALCTGAWNEGFHRYFIAYRGDNDFRHVLGLPVIDEFCTFSSPIFFAPIPLLGKIYNAGITLGHRRDSEMSIDSGWPPLCIGFDAPAPELPADWEAQLLSAVQGSKVANAAADGSEYELQRLVVGQAEVIATDAPLLPEQLRRLCGASVAAPFRIAFATGNRITRTEKAAPLDIRAASEATLAELLHRIKG